MSDAAALYDAKAHTYATFGNGVVLREVARVLPEGGALLDIGCASGGLLAAFAGTASRRVGIEISPAAAREAEAFADEVIVAPVEDAKLPPASFDVIVLADVLEHLPDPVQTLRAASGWLKPDGHVVVSVPNIAHWKGRLTVARGLWPAEESGLFDATHLRFFNEERVAELLTSAGFGDVSVRPVVPMLRNHVPTIRTLPHRVGQRLERVWQRVGAARPNLFGYQLVAVGRHG